MSSTRPWRIGGQVGTWAAGRGAASGAAVDLIDLADVNLPFLDEEHEPIDGNYRLEHTLLWAQRVTALDAVLIVTAEYNSSFPAPLKNALDCLGPEWQGKPVAMVGYGGTSSGTRAVQALLPVVTALGMLSIGATYIPYRARMHEGRFTPDEADDRALDYLLQRVERFAASLNEGDGA